MEGFDKDAFMAGIELGIDWNLYIPPEDIKLYYQLIEERGRREEAAKAASQEPCKKKPDGSRT